MGVSMSSASSAALASGLLAPSAVPVASQSDVLAAAQVRNVRRMQAHAFRWEQKHTQEPAVLSQALLSAMYEAAVCKQSVEPGTRLLDAETCSNDG